MRWAFLGCKDQSRIVLNKLNDCGYQPELMVCLSGVSRPEIDEFRQIAEDCGAEFYLDTQLDSIKDKLSQMDFALVCRFNLLPPEIFSCPKLGCINIHCSLLPKYRGIHPVQWALVNGESETGVTIHKIDAGVDTGPVLRQETLTIRPEHDIWSLTDDLNHLSASACAELFGYIFKHNALPEGRKIEKGDHFYARRRVPADSEFKWTQPRQDIYNLIRAMQPPMPLAYFSIHGGETVPVQSCRIIDSGYPEADKYRAGYVIAKSEDGYHIKCADGVVVIKSPVELRVGSQLG